MRRGAGLVLVAILALPGALLAQAERPTAGAALREVITTIQIHGNNATPDAEILALAGVTIGAPFGATTIAEVERRLSASGRFEHVEVRKRFASIEDESQIALVIVIDERPVKILRSTDGAGQPVRIVRRPVWGGAMFVPILDVEDGYGVTYGAVVAYADVAGERSRLLFPLSWGGRKRAAVEFEQPFAQGVVGRVRGGLTRERRRNPAYVEDDDRTRGWGRAETRAWRDLRAGSTFGWERVEFAGERESWRSAAADVTFDSRADPVFPRDAVFASASRTYLWGETTGSIARTSFDLRGYVGVIGAPVVLVRLQGDTADRPLPRYFKPLLGGWSNLRGLAAGSFVDDNRLASSLELRVPLSSPLSVARAGVSVFVDRGKVYPARTAARDSPWRTGVGASAWFSATIVKAGVSVARARGGDVRVNVGIDVEY